MKQRPFIKAKMTNLREAQEVRLMQAGDHVLSFTLCLSLVQAQHAVGQSMQRTVRKCRAQKQWVEDVIQLRMTQLCPTYTGSTSPFKLCNPKSTPREHTSTSPTEHRASHFNAFKGWRGRLQLTEVRVLLLAG